MLGRALALLTALLLATVLPVAPAAATPVCTGEDKTACGGRTVPEPSMSVGYLTFTEYNAALASLAEEFPGALTIGSIGQSPIGNEVLQVTLTNPESDIPLDQRQVVYIVQSIHGNEPGGREGMIRFIEDLLRTDDPEMRALLGRIQLVQTIPNADGWISGDVADGGAAYSRGNSEGVDLNRLFPWRGFIPEDREPVSQPEVASIVDDVETRRAAGQPVTATADIHGMLQDDSAVWTLFSSGEFDLGGLVRQVRIGEAITAEVDETLGDDALFTLGQAAGGVVMPTKLTSSSEFGGGLSGSGFTGDWLAQQEGFDSPSVSTIELFFNNRGNAENQFAAYTPEISQIHVDSVRAILRATLRQAVTEYDVTLSTPGEVGVVADPTAVLGATPLRFFDDLDEFLDEPTRRLDAADLAGGSGLDGLSTLVLYGDLGVDDAEAMAGVRAFAEGGGTVVLTDAALQALPALYDDLADDAVSMVGTSIGNADFTDFEHPLAEHVREETLHTYEPATLGYDTASESEAPVWRVNRTAWEDGGGETVATTDDETSIGQRALGDGSVRVIGGLLPVPTDQNKVLYGLSDYAPMDTGYYVFVNALGGELQVAEGTFDPGEGPSDDGDPGEEDPGERPGDGDPGDPDDGNGPGDPGDGGGPGDPGDPGDPGEEPGAEDDVRRAAGEGRVETSVELSSSSFDRASTVVLARADEFPDALAAAGLAAEVDAPVLLTPTDGLAGVVAGELERLGAQEAYLMGGTAALGPQVEHDLEAIDVAHTRIGGAERNETAALIAGEIVELGGPVEAAIVALGQRSDGRDAWPDALAAGNLAAAGRAPILLARPDELPEVTAAALDRILDEGDTVFVAGGTDAVGQQPEETVAADGFRVQRLAGETRYGTAVAIVEEARRQGAGIDQVLLASGELYADALFAAPAAHRNGGVMLLAAPDDLANSPATRDFLAAEAAAIDTAVIVGGPNTISEAVARQVDDLIADR